MKNLTARKKMRLEGYDYSRNGAYFVTFCVKDKHPMLGEIVGCDNPARRAQHPQPERRDDPGTPQSFYAKLSEYGEIVFNYINQIDSHYNNMVHVDKFAIMPNHIHMILLITSSNLLDCSDSNGVPRSSRPTMLLPRVIAALKKISNKAFGFDMWQSSYYDHIIRSEADYRKIWQYIDNNPTNWAQDEYF